MKASSKLLKIAETSELGGKVAKALTEMAANARETHGGLTQSWKLHPERGGVGPRLSGNGKSLDVISENFKYQSKHDAFGAAKRDLGIPYSQQPDAVKSVPLEDKWGKKILDDTGRPIQTREYHFTRLDGSKVVIQDHSAGHKFDQGGIGDQGPHYNVREFDSNTGNAVRNSVVNGAKDHYSY